MNKFIVLVFSIVLVLISGCSSNNFQIKLSTPKSFTPGKASPIEFKITDSEGKPVEGAKVSAVLKMQGMSHGDLSMQMQEIGDGVYAGKANIEMEGDYTAAIKIDYKGAKWAGEKRFSIVYKKAQ
ncbi:FixH family protein [Neobacillus sp. NRS-1170]|uniref:FixH family protein n=1 Tax=Neobacillus sp. NRS-1170 TaxID=3233898 RepID=UPI003D2E72AF